jgi:hypothetical protein
MIGSRMPGMEITQHLPQKLGLVRGEQLRGDRQVD